VFEAPAFVHRFISVNKIMSSIIYLEQRGDSSEDALIARLRRFVEDSDLTFYQIESESELATKLSMWLSRSSEAKYNRFATDQESF
jgi:hypothetical protein